MEIKAFSPEDQKATVAFMKAIYKEMGWPESSHDGFEDLEKFFQIPKNGALFLVKDKKGIVGTAGFVKLNERDALLKRFYITQDMRGSGIAQKLLKRLLNEAKKIRCSRVVLDVTKLNKRAIRFYEKNGFTTYDQVPIVGWPESEMPKIFNYYFLSI